MQVLTGFLGSTKPDLDGSNPDAVHGSIEALIHFKPHHYFTQNITNSWSFLRDDVRRYCS